MKQFICKILLLTSIVLSGCMHNASNTIDVSSNILQINCFVIADSNHGYKMLGVGKLVAKTICGHPSTLLKPFRYSRYEEGDLHPVSNSPFPWS